MDAADTFPPHFPIRMGEYCMKIGFIGAGNMGGAILKGALKSGYLSADEVMIYDLNEALTETWVRQFGVTIAQSNRELAQCCEWVVLAVKPVFLEGVLKEIAPVMKNQKVISIAAGWSVEMLKSALSGCEGIQLLRVMPNTPALVGAGLSALCEETSLDAESFVWAQRLFGTLGVVQIVPERLIDAVIAVSGSSPAYVFMFIDAMADAAVKLGMPRQMAIEAAAQAVMGSAKMVLDTHLHPAVLKDQVCSPGGTTIEAVQALEEGGMRAAVIKAMVACADKNRQMTEAQNRSPKA